MFSKVVVFCACVAAASAAVSVLPPQPKPEKFQDVEGCYVPELDAVIPSNSSLYGNEDCMQYACSNSYVYMYSCGVISYDLSAMPGCYVFEDKEKPYPDCCEQVRCPEQDSVN